MVMPEPEPEPEQPPPSPHLLSAVDDGAKIQSNRLHIYDGIINKKEKVATIIGSGATTVYLSERTVKKMGLEITRIDPRTVIIADKDKVLINGMVSFDLELGDLPMERITAYTFPLNNIDLILGLPWLERYNAHTDWKVGSRELTRNGRRYVLYPRRRPPNIKTDIKMATAEEFNLFCDTSTELSLFSATNLNKKRRKMSQQTSKDHFSYGKSTL